MNCLVYEPKLAGHTPDYMRYLLEYSGQQTGVRLTLAVHPDFQTEFWAGAGWSESYPSGDLLPLTQTEAEAANVSDPVRAGLSRWRSLDRVCQESDPDVVLVTEMDNLQLPLALRLPSGGQTPLAGILFRPSVHYAQFAGTRLTWKEKLRDVRKRVLYAGMLRNPRLSRVFSLDPYFPGYARSRFSEGDKVQHLPDPVVAPDALTSGDWDRTLEPRWPERRVRFLLFGALTERKGVFQLLDALRILPSDVAAKTAVLLAGVPGSHVRGRLWDEMRAVTDAQPDLWLELEARYLTTDELTAAVLSCDVVLAPYQRFVGSSGVLFWAAASRRPVLTQDYGLVGRLTREWAIGSTVDTGNPEEIARSIARFVDGHRSAAVGREATDRLLHHRPERFAETIFNALREAVE